LFVAKKDSAPPNLPADGKLDTIVGRETEFKGVLTSSGIIRIDGRVEGEVIHKGDIAIGETGTVNASIKARNVTIAGTVTGNVDAAGRLELLPTARLFGDITVSALVISEGAVFRGGSEMKAQDKPPGHAKPDRAPEKPA
jgi:cytoskeletal protein CcmA (bactofilin family)